MFFVVLCFACCGIALLTRKLFHIESVLPGFRFVTAVYPSVDDDVITSPYNSVLAMRELTEKADCVLPIENQVCVGSMCWWCWGGGACYVQISDLPSVPPIVYKMVRYISSTWLKTVVTTLFYITSYNSFAPSPNE